MSVTNILFTVQDTVSTFSPAFIEKYVKTSKSICKNHYTVDF